MIEYPILVVFFRQLAVQSPRQHLRRHIHELQRLLRWLVVDAWGASKGLLHDLFAYQWLVRYSELLETLFLPRHGAHLFT
jgi:hypothetical protein